ncbi:MAG: glycosyltransferase family 9 protein [Candidatus Omnitrophota bacterium]|jgi:lipopolysaccharide heptosyltransferase II|nr:MAG: glycosyltransferase family 9 protein [Candidatus Omnitrophota bacterium]
MTTSKGNTRRFLIINPFGIGDVLFTTPVLKGIKEKYPESFIGYWCNQRVGALLKTNPYLDAVIDLNRGDLKRIFKESPLAGIKKLFSLIGALKKYKFDTCIDYSLDYRYSLIAKLMNIKQRIGYNFKRKRGFFTRSLDIEGYNEKHMVEYYIDLARESGIEIMDKRMSLEINKESRQNIDSLLLNHGIGPDEAVIGIVPGAGQSWGKDAYIKHWPAEKFAELADRIIDQFNIKVIIVASREEKDITSGVLSCMRNKALDITGIVSLTDLPALLKRCRVLVTNDGGPLHIAVALDIRTVSIFGPVSEVVYGPYPKNDEHIVLKRQLDCRPCYKDFKLAHCVHSKECIDSIQVDQVFDAVRRLM